MKLARMERRQRVDGVEEWKAAQGYALREGMHARFFDRRERFAKPVGSWRRPTAK
jgi:hypothetical protein